MCVLIGQTTTGHRSLKRQHAEDIDTKLSSFLVSSAGGNKNQGTRSHVKPPTAAPRCVRPLYGKNVGRKIYRKLWYSKENDFTPAPLLHIAEGLTAGLTPARQTMYLGSGKRLGVSRHTRR